MDMSLAEKWNRTVRATQFQKILCLHFARPKVKVSCIKIKQKYFSGFLLEFYLSGQNQIVNRKTTSGHICRSIWKYATLLTLHLGCFFNILPECRAVKSGGVVY